MLRDFRHALFVSDGMVTDNKSEHHASAPEGADVICAATPKAMQRMRNNGVFF